ncbi:hypothetical protein R4P47_15725 [Rhodococcus sp. IEGM 1370]|jgi:hypothetical protein|uniref:hypothetical protein n=1 Tax=Rhodococcus sp. IEGM 1370 TaxID=3082222 RepID=UPI0029534F3B|nr:hypothetical protein [Rhodococcus sp. IEGM 1370]MDV8078012.1 hypothetical protein [Rhodococcus sp. IEGM 1370]
MTRQPAAIDHGPVTSQDNDGEPQERTTPKNARLTVNLIGKSNEALSRASDLSGYTKTEVINKALQLIEMTFAAQDAGGGIWIQDTSRSQPERLRII